MDTIRSPWRGDALVAVLLAAVLGAAWAACGWADLTALRLPDTDDVVRLQQIRDWLGGQGWTDLTQHRLGASGVAMHWSRLADLGPAVLIAALAPLFGRHGAEVAAVAIWPPILFAAALFLVARIARALGQGAPGTAAVIAAVAYPATTLFLPGRIDHHGLQMVLLLGATLAAIGPASAGAGFAVGMLGAASLVIGLETAPLLGVLGAAMVAGWVVDARSERLSGLSVGALSGLAIGRGLFMTSGWAYPACDGFTGEAWQAGALLSLAPVLLAGITPRVATRSRRAAVALVVGGTAAASAVLASPGCLSPYGDLDPRLATAWLSQVGEAQRLFDAPLATALGYAGLMTAGIVASAWRLRVERQPGWALLLALQLAAGAMTLVQLRGAYAGALLAAPGLAAVVGAARTRGLVPLIGAWIASAGMLYPIAAEALTPRRASVEASGAGCDGRALLPALAALPAGTVAGPVDLGAWGLAATPHRFLAAPYHRDGAGILAADRLLKARATDAAGMAALWHITYLVTCAPPSTMVGWHRIGHAGDATIWSRFPLLASPAPL